MSTNSINQLTYSLKDEATVPLNKIKGKFEELDKIIKNTMEATNKFSIVCSELSNINLNSLVVSAENSKQALESNLSVVENLAFALNELKEIQIQGTTSADSSSNSFTIWREHIGSLITTTAALTQIITFFTTEIGKKIASLIKDTAATISHTVAQKASVVATNTLAIAQKALNAVMRANPIALVVTAIGALIAGAVAAYNQFEGFRQVVDNVWNSIKGFASAIWDYLVKAFNSVASAIAPVGKVLKSLWGTQEAVAANMADLSEETVNYANANEDAFKASTSFSESLKTQNQQLNTNLSTIGGIEQKISDLKQKQSEASVEQAIALEKEIRLWQKKREEMENSIIIGAATPPALKPLEANVTSLNLKKLGVEEIKIPLTIDNGVLNATAERAQKKLEQTFSQEKNLFEPYKEGINGIASTMQSLSGIVGESAGAWLSWGANLMQTIGQAIPQILMLMGVQLGASQTQANANQTQAITGAAAAMSSIPFVGPVLAIAAMASMIAAFASMPKPKKFAAGGIVYGNTFAQIGEYPGAANNPEVIAPLSKLKQLIQPADSGGGTYELRLRGRDFVAVAEKYKRINNRTR